eukprot:CAMPEP_0184532558 /NCGR_PEP_ID=MMETSP0198_2-20121128/14233_1 /TAXON_ID=1112570 /ORGANISM="Thraustochytrium sp., Strain LLF1b" /LENGTH=249 /DNA_ID=CAMNT_0026925167 /DNA_START=161 /DNA_END=907 /DNA_ORIENTATION=+
MTTAESKSSTFSKVVASGRDDAQESNLALSVGGSTLDLGVQDPNQGISEVGIRFRSLDIPPGVVIDSASIRFTASADSGSTVPSVEILGEDTNDSLEFGTTSQGQLGSVRLRPKTTSRVTWDVPQFVANKRFATPDIASVMQEIINRQGWEAGNSLTLLLRNTVNSNNSPRQVFSFEGASNVNQLAFLLVTFSFPSEADRLEDDLGENDDLENLLLTGATFVGVFMLVMVFSTFIQRSKSKQPVSLPSQ